MKVINSNHSISFVSNNKDPFTIQNRILSINYDDGLTVLNFWELIEKNLKLKTWDSLLLQNGISVSCSTLQEWVNRICYNKLYVDPEEIFSFFVKYEINLNIILFNSIHSDLKLLSLVLKHDRAYAIKLFKECYWECFVRNSYFPLDVILMEDNETLLSFILENLEPSMSIPATVYSRLLREAITTRIDGQRYNYSYETIKALMSGAGDLQCKIISKKLCEYFMYNYHFKEIPVFLKNKWMNVDDTFFGIPAIHILAVFKALDIIKIFVEAGVDLQARDSFEMTALHYAVMGKSLKVVQFLIDHGIAIDVATSSGITPLHIAVATRNFPVIQCLVERGASLNAIDVDGYTPYHRAFIHPWHRIPSLSIAQYLIDNGANPLESPEILYTMIKAGYKKELAAYTSSIPDSVKKKCKEIALRKLNAHVNNLGGISSLQTKDDLSNKESLLLEGYYSQVFVIPLLKVFEEIQGIANVSSKGGISAVISALKYLQNDHIWQDQDVLARIKDKQPTILITGYFEHATTVSFIGNLIVFCDTCCSKGKTSVHFFYYDSKNLDENVIALIRQAAAGKNDVFQKIKDLLDVQQGEYEKSLGINSSIPSQIVGNCTYTALESAIYGILMAKSTVSLNEKPLNIEALKTAMSTSETLFHDAILSLRLKLFDRYLRLHDTGDSPYIIDSQLIKNIDEQLLKEVSSCHALIDKRNVIHEKAIKLFNDNPNCMEETSLEFDALEYLAKPTKLINYYRLFKYYICDNSP